MPGTLGGAFLVDYLGPKNTMVCGMSFGMTVIDEIVQITGLLCQAVIGFIMSGLYVQLTKHIAAFAVVYGIFLSFGELGMRRGQPNQVCILIAIRSRKLFGTFGQQEQPDCYSWTILRRGCRHRESRSICWNLGYVQF
jgi:hypothetical protein